MEKSLIVNSSPHIRGKSSTNNIMLDVCIALVPTLIASVLHFGARSLLLSLVCVVSCIAFEYTYRKLLKLSFTINDMSAAVTGVILALNLPSSLPLWMAVIAAFVAIVIVKQLFGGLGKNFANPAIVGRIVIFISFAASMTNWGEESASGAAVDAVASATPLGGAVGISYLDMFLGNIGGSMGETCKLTLLIGGIYLVIKKVITATTPIAFMGTVFVFSFLLGQDPIFHLLSGGLFLGAIFMATDYVTSPVTERGKLIFGIGCGVITVIIRVFSYYPEGVSFALLLMNIISPHIDRLCTSKPFGGVA